MLDVPPNVDSLQQRIAADDRVAVIIDMPRKSALKENPDVYVRRGNAPPEDIGRHFDAAQFSAAYESVKKTIWIFSDDSNLALIAARAAVTFMVQFGLAPNDDALAAAKIEPTQFSQALDELARRDNTLLPIIDELRRVRGESLVLPLRMLMTQLSIGDEDERATAADILARALQESGLTKSSLDDLDAALIATRWLLEHERATSEAEGRANLSLKEADFKRSVQLYLRTHASKDIDPEPEFGTASGRVDFALRLMASRIQVPVELKAEERLFRDVVNDRVAQPFHYATDVRFGRIAILYVRFRDDRARRPVEDFEVRHLRAEGSPLLLICIGQRTTSVTASRSAPVTAIITG